MTYGAPRRCSFSAHHPERHGARRDIKDGRARLVDFRDVSLHPAPLAAPSPQTAPFAPFILPSHREPRKLREKLRHLALPAARSPPRPLPPAAQRAAAVAHAHLRRRRAQVRRDEPAAPPHQGRARRGGRRARPHHAGGGRAPGGARGEGRRDERGDHGPARRRPAPPEPQRAGRAEARAELASSTPRSAAANPSPRSRGRRRRCRSS